MNKTTLILKVGGIVLLTLSMAGLFLKGMYFSCSTVFLGIVALGISLYSDQRKVIRKMERMISSIQHGEFNYSFTESGTNDDIQRLTKSMNEALIIFRHRTYSSMKEETETEAWQKLIRVLTHEMMNSLAPIISLSETFASQPLPETIEEDDYDLMLQAMQTIHRRSKGLVAFINNYRQLTRLHNPVPQWIVLDDFFSDILVISGSDNMFIETDIIPHNLTLLADKTMLEQLMINLIKNAKEACCEKENPIIRIKACKVAGKTQISVEDNGTGIVSEALDKIFVPFYTTKSGGSGIGLSLCRQIMNCHNGKIYVESEINKGTIFTLIF